MTRRIVAEGAGTALLLYVIVGSGIAAAEASDDAALQLFAHAIVVGVGLGVLIALFQSVSGSHFNPSVTIAFWRSGSMTPREAGGYVVAQLTGAVTGVVAANLSFDLAAVTVSSTSRDGAGRVGAEGIATFVLVLVILVLVRTDRAAAVPVAVGAWVSAIVFATSSTGFANPAVTGARMFTDTYTGIAPASVLGFLAAQVVAGLGAAPVARFFAPSPAPVETPT